MKTFKKMIVGKKPAGKKILVIAGVHGDELTPVHALSIFSKYLDGIEGLEEVLENIRSITILNGVNIEALEGCTREIPQSNTSDLNRMFKESSADSFKDLKMEITSNDVIIDIHSSPTCANFALIDIDEYSNSIKNWCEKAGLKTAFRYSGADTIKRYCLQEGKMAITLELNQMNKIDYDSAYSGSFMISSLIKEVHKFELIPGIPGGDIKELKEVKTYHTGIVDEAHVKNGEIIRKGEILCKILGFELYDTIGEIVSNVDGMVICEPGKSFVNRGETVFLVQPK